jgi:hypothetical protein
MLSDLSVLQLDSANAVLFDVPVSEMKFMGCERDTEGHSTVWVRTVRGKSKDIFAFRFDEATQKVIGMGLNS